MNIHHHVEGSTFQVRDIIVVVKAIDKDVHDVSRFIGMTGIVCHLNYDCGAGQMFPNEPMIGVLMLDGTVEEFWSEEIVLFDAKVPVPVPKKR